MRRLHCVIRQTKHNNFTQGDASMQPLNFNARYSMRQLIAFGITFYQQRISPFKGFSCAHHHLRHRGSCSQFAKRAVLKHGAFRLIPLMKMRFNAL